MHLPKAILFDLDGTLTDTLADLAAATNEALQKNGSPVYPLDAYRHMVGSGARVLIRRALGEKAEETAVDRVLADFLLIYDRDCLKCTAPYEGIPAVIDWFAGRSIPMAVVTNKPEKQAIRIVEHCFGSPFAAVCGGRPGRPIKPDPTAALEVLRDLDIAPADAWFVGDSDVDMLTAHHAGMTAVGAAWGFRGEEELREAGADDIARLPLDLIPE